MQARSCRAIVICICLLVISLSCDGNSHYTTPNATFVTVPARPALATRFDEANRLRVIGSSETFGSIDGLGFVGGDRFVVLDRMFARIHLIAENGDLISYFGRRGNGPGEFFYPVSLVVDDNDYISILDRGNLRITELKLVGDSLRLSREIALAFVGTSHCAIGTQIYVFGDHEGYLLHELDHDGNVARSFGPQTRAGADRVLHSITKLACSAETGILAFVPETIGVLHLFHVSGEHIGNYSVPEYIGVPWLVRGNSLRYEPPPAGFAHMARTLYWHDNDIVVQLERVPRDESGVVEVRSFSVSNRSWRAIDSSHRGEVIALRRHIVLMAIEDPFPLIEIYEVVP